MEEENLIVRCLRCGTKNRIPPAKLCDRPVCGQCHAYLDDIIIHCLRCGAKNRMPEHRLNETPICGVCGIPLVSGGTPLKILDINDANFSTEVLHCSGAVAVICWSALDNTGSFRDIDLIFEDLIIQYAYGIKATRLEIHKNHQTALQYDIRSAPTILFFKEGRLIHALTENLSREEIERYILTVTEINRL